MAEIVNLRRFKKQQQRTDKQREADANRRAHGRTKAEKQLTDTERAKATQHLDGHQLNTDDEA